MQKIKEFLKRNWQIILYCAIFVALFFFMAFRATSVGTDAVVYRDIYEQIKSRQIGIKYVQWEIGFSALCYLFGRLLGLSYLWFQIFTSFVILTCFALFIWKNSSNKLLSLFIFIAFGLYFYSFNALRQGLAIAIFLVNLTIFLKDRKWWKYFLLLPVAVLMHNSIILCYLLYIVFFIKLDYKWSVIAVCIAAVITIFMKDIVLFLHQNLHISYLEKYINSEFFDQRVTL